MADVENTPNVVPEPSTPPPAAPPPATPPPAAPQQYQPAPPQPQYAQYGQPAGAPQGSGFWSRFFDFSFREFITPSIIKVLFIIVMVVIVLTMLGAIIVGFMAGAAEGVFALIGSVIYGFLMLLFTRVWLEIIIIFFRIKDDTNAIARSKKM